MDAQLLRANRRSACRTSVNRKARLTKPAVLFALLAATAGAVPALAAAPGPGKIGGPPTRPLNRPDEGKQTTPARVIGVGHTYDGWVEIDAYGWQPMSDTPGERHQVCTWIETKRLPNAGYGSCFGAGELSRPIAIESASQLVAPKPLRSRFIAGSLAPDVTRVELTVQRVGGKNPEQIQATVARVSGNLLRQLHQESPFGYFFAKVRGTVSLKAIRATAYDEGGQEVGSTSGLTPEVIAIASPPDSSARPHPG